VQTLPKNSFLFLSPIPEELSHVSYCGVCFTQKVASPLASYDQTLERAKALFVYHKHQAEETRRVNRSEKTLRVQDCTDREETLLRLAFLAAKGNFNALVDVDIVPKKVRHFGYQTSLWQGSGVPARVSISKSDDGLVNDTRTAARRTRTPLDIVESC
jgi:hypothetical protein